MSATRDTNEKVTFAFTNFYQLYKKGVAEAKKAGPVVSPLKDPSKEGVHPGLTVRAYQPTEFISKRVEQVKLERNLRAPVIRVAGCSRRAEKAVLDLRSSLSKLTSLQTKLSFLLKEVDEFSPKKSES